MSDMVGQTIGGYPVERVLDKSSYSELYQLTTSSTPLAGRVLRDNLRGDPALNSAIARGWEAARAVTHPNLVISYNSGVDGAIGAFRVQEFVPGKNLRQMVLGGSKIAWRDALVLAEQLFSAVKALHGAGMLHGDISPFNLTITQDQDLKLDNGGALTGLDRNVVNVIGGGPVGYQAPEIVQGSAPSKGSDIYSAGACLFFVLAGRDPYPGENARTVAQAVVERKHAPVSALRDDLPPEAEEFIGRLMAKDPTQRYGEVQDVLNELARLQKGQELAPFKGGPPAQPVKFRPASDTTAAEAVRVPSSLSGKKPISGIRPAPSGAAAGASGSVRGVSASGSRQVVPGTRSGATPGVGGSAKLSQQVLAIGGTGRVFGRLDTHVKSTIPQSDLEKKGDDLYRQGQLPLALNCWREALENNAPHIGLKVKIELAERDLKREAFIASMDEARTRLDAGDFKGTIARTREALLNVENDQQRQEVLQVEGQAQRGLLQEAEAGRKRMIIGGAIIGVVVIVAIIVVIHVRNAALEKAREAEAEEKRRQALTQVRPDPVKTPPTTQNETPKFSVNIANAVVERPAPWVPSGNEPNRLYARPPGSKIPAAMVEFNKEPAGATLASRLKELRSSHLFPNAKKLDDMELLGTVDGMYPTSEIGYSYSREDGKTCIHYFYLIAGPNGALYIAEFDGPEDTFSIDLRNQMRPIIRSWKYNK